MDYVALPKIEVGTMPHISEAPLRKCIWESSIFGVHFFYFFPQVAD